ncbi:MAG TPA: sugar ABC transporter permease [Actinoplanes sp.]|jgi:multiple sugar transport system permease protein
MSHMSATASTRSSKAPRAKTRASAVPTGPSTGAGKRFSLAPYLFIAPFMVLFLAMFVAPLVYSGYLSLFNTRLVGGTVFVGLDNYIEALGDSAFTGGVLRMVRYFFIQVPVMLAIALVAALILDSGHLRVPKLFRVGIFVPFAVPVVVGALMWGYLYGPQFGPVAQLFDKVGWTAPSFLGNNLILSSIANIAVWEFAGYNMIIFYAALRSISPDLYEAAAMDGAGPVRVAWSIKLPLLRPAIFLTVLFSLIGTFQLFNEPQVLKALAPTTITRDWTPNYYAFNLAFVDQRVPYAAAISFMLGFFIVVLSLLFLFAVSRRRRDQ